MKTTILFGSLAMSLMLTPAFAQKTLTGKHGGTASTTVSQKGNTVTGTGTATSANGTTVSGQGSVGKTRTGTSENATVTGPKGGTTTASGTTTKTATGNTASGTVTGPKGGTGTASGTSTDNGNGTTTTSATGTGPRGQDEGWNQNSHHPLVSSAWSYSFDSEAWMF